MEREFPWSSAWLRPPLRPFQFSDDATINARLVLFERGKEHMLAQFGFQLGGLPIGNARHGHFIAVRIARYKARREKFGMPGRHKSLCAVA